MTMNDSLSVLDKIKTLLSSNEAQFITSGFNLFLEANDSVWDLYLQTSPECDHVYQCLSLGKQRLTPDIIDRCWRVLTRIYARGKETVVSPSVIQDIVSKYLKHIFYSLSNNTPQSLTESVLGFMTSAVLYDNHHAGLILSHCNLSHNIYHYMYSYKSPIRPTIIKFIFSFFMTDDYELIRSVMEHRSVFNKIFRYIKYDTLQLSYFILAVLTKHVFSVEISKKLKIALFASASLVQILHLLDIEDLVSLEDDPVTFHLRNQGISDTDVPLCDYVQAFVKILCTSERFGILYAPKLEMVQEYKYNNSSILLFLKAIPYQLRVGERIESLIIELLQYSPDIVHCYLSDEWYRAAPRIQYEWVDALEFLIKLYNSLQISKLKTAMKSIFFLLKKSSLSALVLPPLTAKLDFSKGLQHNNYLCKYLTAKFLDCLLTRIANFVETPLDDLGATVSDLVESVRHLLPDIMTVLSQLKWTTQVSGEQFTEDIDQFGQRIALKYTHMRENIRDTFLNLFLNLLLNYQHLFPLSLLQANYDVSKLLIEHQSISDETLLRIVTILNKAPPGAVKWFASKIEQSPLIVLLNTFMQTKSDLLLSEIEISLFKFSREMSHLCVNSELMTVAFSILRDMLHLTMFLEIDKYVVEVGKQLIIALKSGETVHDKRSYQPDSVSFLIEVLEREYKDTNLCAFLSNFWKNIELNVEKDEKTLKILFYFLSKFFIKLGLKQDDIFKYYSNCFEIIFPSRERMCNYPLSCQIIYFRMLKFFAVWCEPNTVGINDLEEFTIANSFASSLDIHAFIRICGLVASDEDLVNVLKYIPFGYANHLSKATNVYSSKIIKQLYFGEWLIQFTISDYNPENNSSLSTCYTNFLLHIKRLVVLYFDLHEPKLNFESTLDVSNFCHSLLKFSYSVNQDGLALSELTKFCGKVFIRSSSCFNRLQNNILIKSLLKWSRYPKTNSALESREPEAKRMKITLLPNSIITSILDIIANVDCDKCACVVQLLDELNAIIQLENSPHTAIDYIHDIAKDISLDFSHAIATFVDKNEPNETLFIDETHKPSHDTAMLTKSELNMLKALNLNKDDIMAGSVDIIPLNTEIDLDNELASLLKSYQGSLTTKDQTTLSILTTLEASYETDQALKPFVWGTSVDAYLRQQMNTSTHIIQRHNPNDILTNLSSDYLNTTIANFPVTRDYNQFVTIRTCASQEMYDPCFLVPLFSYILAPGATVDCRKFAELGCLGVLFRCLSSLSSDVRASAAHCLQRYTTHLGYSSFREKRQISLILDIVSNTLTEEVSRIPSLHTALLARTVQIMLHPHSELYILLAKFFLSKPTLNTEEIPLFNTMLLSSSPGHKQEKLWMIKLLTEGALSEEDYKFYKRRHVFPLVFSLCDLQTTDKQICLAVVKFARFVCHVPSAWNDLSYYEGITAWAITLRAQILNIPDTNENKEIKHCLDDVFSRR